MDKKYILGVDIGGTNLRMSLIDQDYKMHNQFMTEINNFKGNMIDGIIDIVSKYLKKENKIEAIVFGIPGIVQNNKIFSCPNVVELEKSDLKHIVEKKLKIPVYLEKDVNLIMLAEYNILDIQEKNVLGFFVGTGFGFSMIINGELYEGSHGFAGELGHVPLKGKSKKCNCGNSGCLELYGAGKKLKELTDNNGSKIEDFFVDYENSNEYEEFLENILLGIITAINILDPAVIILGGGVLKMKNFPEKRLRREIKNNLRDQSISDNLKILNSKHEKFGGCLGAGIYGFKTFK